MKITSRSFGWFKGPKSLFILLLLFLTTSGMRRCRWDKWSIQNFQPPTFRKLELPTNFLDSRLPTSLWQPPADVRFIFFPANVLLRFPPTKVLSRFPPTNFLLRTSCRHPPNICFPDDVVWRFPLTEILLRFPPTNVLQRTFRRLKKMRKYFYSSIQYALFWVNLENSFKISIYWRSSDISTYRRPSYNLVFLKKVRK